VRNSPCNVLDPGKGVSVPRPSWSVADFKAVLEHVPTSITLNNSTVQQRVYFRESLEIMFAGHLRLGELIGLNANDFDRTTGRLLVERQKRANGDVADTKTGQHKNIRLLAMGLRAIDRLPRRIGSAPLIPGPRAGRLPRSTLQRAWVTATKEAGYENFHVHDIRHIGLSLIGASRVPMRDIMARGGHASMQSAMRYQHTDPERDLAVAEVVDRMLG
jgi:integrase